MTKLACHRRENAIGSFRGSFSGGSCRAARAELGISLADLAHASGFSIRCLYNFEHQAERTRAATVEAVFGALQRCSKDGRLRMRGVKPAGDAKAEAANPAARAHGAQ